MHLLILNTKSFLTSKTDLLKLSSDIASFPPTFRTIVCVPNSALAYVHDKLRGNPSIALGIQDVPASSSGAFTGNDNLELLTSLGAQFGLIGHPETRVTNSQLEEDITEKIQAVRSTKLTPIIYIGVSFEQTADTLQGTIAVNLQGLVGLKNLHPIFALSLSDWSTESVKSTYKQLKKTFKGDFQFVLDVPLDIQKMKLLTKLSFIDGYVVSLQAQNTDSIRALYDQLR